MEARTVVQHVARRDLREGRQLSYRVYRPDDCTEGSFCVFLCADNDGKDWVPASVQVFDNDNIGGSPRGGMVEEEEDVGNVFEHKEGPSRRVRSSRSLRTPSRRWAEGVRGRESFYWPHSVMGLSREPLRWSLA